jgi:hypothetical protein
MLEVLFLVPLKSSPVGVLLVVLDPRLDRIRDERRPLDIVSLLRDRDVDLVGDRLDAVAAEFLLDAVREKSVARDVADVDDAFLGVCRGLDNGDCLVGEDGVDESPVLGREVGQPDNVNLVDDEEGRLVAEQRLDRVEQLALERRVSAKCLGEFCGASSPAPRWCSHTAR